MLLAAKLTKHQTEGGNQALVGAIPFCREYPGPRFEDKFRQMDGISFDVTNTGKSAPASISVKFWEIKEDIGISERATSHLPFPRYLPGLWIFHSGRGRV